MTPAAGEKKKKNNSRNQVLVRKKKLGKRTSKMISQNLCWVGFRWLEKPRYRGLHTKRKTAIQKWLFRLYGMSCSKFQLSTEKGALDLNWSWTPKKHTEGNIWGRSKYSLNGRAQQLYGLGDICLISGVIQGQENPMSHAKTYTTSFLFQHIFMYHLVLPDHKNQQFSTVNSALEQGPKNSINLQSWPPNIPTWSFLQLQTFVCYHENNSLRISFQHMLKVSVSFNFLPKNECF